MYGHNNNSHFVKSILTITVQLFNSSWVIRVSSIVSSNCQNILLKDFFGKKHKLELFDTFQGLIASNITDDFCGHPSNVGIGSRYSFMAITNISTVSYPATSLGIIIYGGKTVAIMGTSNGYILKVCYSWMRKGGSVWSLGRTALMMDLSFAQTSIDHGV